MSYETIIKCPCEHYDWWYFSLILYPGSFKPKFVKMKSVASSFPFSCIFGEQSTNATEMEPP